MAITLEEGDDAPRGILQAEREGHGGLDGNGVRTGVMEGRENGSDAEDREGGDGGGGAESDDKAGEEGEGGADRDMTAWEILKEPGFLSFCVVLFVFAGCLWYATNSPALKGHAAT